MCGKQRWPVSPVLKALGDVVDMSTHTWKLLCDSGIGAGPVGVGRPVYYKTLIL